MMKFEVTKPTTVEIEPPRIMTLVFDYPPDELYIGAVIKSFGVEYFVDSIDIQREGQYRPRHIPELVQIYKPIIRCEVVVRRK